MSSICQGPAIEWPRQPRPDNARWPLRRRCEAVRKPRGTAAARSRREREPDVRPECGPRAKAGSPCSWFQILKSRNLLKSRDGDLRVRRIEGVGRHPIRPSVATCARRRTQKARFKPPQRAWIARDRKYESHGGPSLRDCLGVLSNSDQAGEDAAMFAFAMRCDARISPLPRLTAQVLVPVHNQIAHGSSIDSSSAKIQNPHEI